MDVEEQMGPANLLNLFSMLFLSVVLHVPPKGNFPSLLVTQGVKDPSHSMSHPHFLSQLVVWLSGMCTVLLHTCYDVPVLHAGDATAAPGEELLGHVDCAGLSGYGLPLFYKTLSRKDGLIAIFKSPVLIC